MTGTDELADTLPQLIKPAILVCRTFPSDGQGPGDRIPHYRHPPGAQGRLPAQEHWHRCAVTLIQRFGSALNLNLHFHILFLDGVYLPRENGPPLFRRVKAPDRSELEVAQSRSQRSVLG